MSLKHNQTHNTTFTKFLKSNSFWSKGFWSNRHHRTKRFKRVRCLSVYGNCGDIFDHNCQCDIFSTSHVSIPIGKLRTFIASLAVVLTGVLLLLLVLLGYRHTLKTVAICFILIAAFAGHFTDTYGTVYDTTMLQNALQTDTGRNQRFIKHEAFNPVLCCWLVCPSVGLLGSHCHLAHSKQV